MHRRHPHIGRTPSVGHHKSCKPDIKIAAAAAAATGPGGAGGACTPNRTCHRLHRVDRRGIEIAGAKRVAVGDARLEPFADVGCDRPVAGAGCPVYFIPEDLVVGTPPRPLVISHRCIGFHQDGVQRRADAGQRVRQLQGPALVLVGDGHRDGEFAVVCAVEGTHGDFVRIVLIRVGGLFVVGRFDESQLAGDVNLEVSLVAAAERPLGCHALRIACRIGVYRPFAVLLPCDAHEAADGWWLVHRCDPDRHVERPVLWLGSVGSSDCDLVVVVDCGVEVRLVLECHNAGVGIDLEFVEVGSVKRPGDVLALRVLRRVSRHSIDAILGVGRRRRSRDRRPLVDVCHRDGDPLSVGRQRGVACGHHDHIGRPGFVIQDHALFGLQLPRTRIDSEVRLVGGSQRVPQVVLISGVAIGGRDRRSNIGSRRRVLRD